jgi:hypothetical protein
MMLFTSFLCGLRDKMFHPDPNNVVNVELWRCEKVKKKF